jgi:hypothetical protein
MPGGVVVGACGLVFVLAEAIHGALRSTERCVGSEGEVVGSVGAWDASTILAHPYPTCVSEWVDDGDDRDDRIRSGRIRVGVDPMAPPTEWLHTDHGPSMPHPSERFDDGDDGDGSIGDGVNALLLLLHHTHRESAGGRIGSSP